MANACYLLGMCVTIAYGNIDFYFYYGYYDSYVDYFSDVYYDDDDNDDDDVDDGGDDGGGDDNDDARFSNDTPVPFRAHNRIIMLS